MSIIYQKIPESDPIKQGDIFYPLPFGYVSLNKITKQVAEGQYETGDWHTFKNEEKIATSVALIGVRAIVATQDCDTNTSPLITFFRIIPFAQAIDRTVPERGDWSAKKYVNLITEQSRLNAKWFYLPKDPEVGIDEKMGVTFHSTFQLDRKELEQYKSLRICRLDDESYQHYRESVANYFRRYPYDEWYPFTKEEFEEYKRGHPLAEPRDWQKDES